MPVHALEDDALAVEEHQAVAELKAPEAQRLLRDPGDLAILAAQGQREGVEIRRLRAPERRALHREAGLHALRGEGAALLFQQRALALKTQAERTAAAGLCLDGDGAHRKALVERRYHREVEQRGLRQRAEPNTAENTRKAIEILILKPAARRPLEHAHGELVLPLAQRCAQIKLRGIEAVLAVAEVLPVEPEGKAALHALEEHMQLPAAQPLRHGEEADIVRHGVEELRHLAGLQVLLRVPGVLGIHVGGLVVPFQLDMRGHADRVPAAHVVVGGPEALRRGVDIFGVVELPHAVETEAQAALPQGELLRAAEHKVVGMGGQTPVGKHGRVLHKAFIAEFFHASLQIKGL